MPLTMRYLEGDLLQRLLEYLPFEQYLPLGDFDEDVEASHTVKAISRAWRTAARCALTRGRWKSLRVVDDSGELMCRKLQADVADVSPGARRAFNRDARDAWKSYPGEALLLIRNWAWVPARNYLLLVVEPTKQGFRSIIAAFEDVKQSSRGRPYIGNLMDVLCQWLRQALPDSFGGDGDRPYSTFERIATPEWLGDELGRWADPALAAEVINNVTRKYFSMYYDYNDWHPRYDDLARTMSANWADSGKRARFVALLAQSQAQEDAEVMMRDEFSHGSDDNSRSDDSSSSDDDSRSHLRRQLRGATTRGAKPAAPVAAYSSSDDSSDSSDSDDEPAKPAAKPAAKPNDDNVTSIFIDNLSWTVEESHVRECFANCGEIQSVRFLTDRETGEFRGFGHVDFDTADAATAAVALAGAFVDNRAIRVDYAKPNV